MSQHESARWRIGEAAKRSGVAAANIRYYEKERLLSAGVREDNQYRLYSDSDVHRLRFIRLCRAMDMSLDEVRTLLALGSHVWPVEFTLTCRKTMRYRLLLGSKALVDGQWLIDPSRTYIQDKPQILTSSGAQ